MRVVKKLYANDEKTLFASRVFDDVIRTINLPLDFFDTLEFNFGYGFTYIKDSTAAIGLDMEDPALYDNDARAVRTLITFEMFRLFARRKTQKDVPRLIEDIIVGRDMVKSGYADDLTYLFYKFASNHRIKDIKDFLRFNVPWLIFHGHDTYNEELFLNVANGRTRYNYKMKLRRLFNTLKKDLVIDKNLDDAIKAYEGVMNAGD